MAKGFEFSLPGDLISVCHNERKQSLLGNTTLTLKREKKKCWRAKRKNRMYMKILDHSYHLIPNETPLLLTGRYLSTLILTDKDDAKRSLVFMFSTSLSADVRAAFLRLLSSQSRLMVLPLGSSKMRPLLGVDLKQQTSHTTLDLDISDIHSVSDSVSTFPTTVKLPVESENIASVIEKEFCYLNKEVSSCATCCAKAIRRPPPSATNEPRENDFLRPSVEMSQDAREATKRMVKCTRDSNRKIAKSIRKIGRRIAAKCPWCTRASKATGVGPALAASFVGMNTVFDALVDASFVVARACADRISNDMSSVVSKNAGRVTENVLHTVLNVSESFLCIREVMPTNIAKNVATSAVCNVLNGDQQFESM